jgi:hypothetical protein
MCTLLSSSLNVNSVLELGTATNDSMDMICKIPMPQIRYSTFRLKIMPTWVLSEIEQQLSGVSHLEESSLPPFEHGRALFIKVA